jgi:hypothetical protein
MSTHPTPLPQLAPILRQILRDDMDGLTLVQITVKVMEKLPHRKNNLENIRKALKKMPDAYVDRWTRECVRTGRHEAVWCVVVPPADCPPPGNQVDRDRERRSAMKKRKGES